MKKVTLSEDEVKGNVGFISFNENLTVSDFTVEDIEPEEQPEDVKGWKFTGNGSLDGENIRLSGEGDNIGISDIEKKDNYSVKTTIKQGDGDGTVGVVLGTKSAKNPKEGAVVANVAPSSGKVRLFCFQGGLAGDMKAEKAYAELEGKDTYDFDISVKQRHLIVNINEEKVIDMEISDTSFEGNVGLIAFNEDMTASDFKPMKLEPKKHSSNTMLKPKKSF